jgi:hypothetical protein
VLIGPAGIGKTYTVDAIRIAYQHAGHTVLGSYAIGSGGVGAGRARI